MNISYEWLNHLIEHGLSPDELAVQLTRVGLAVEGVHPHGDDFVLDLDLTSNRPDCLSHLGVARELRVITNAELREIASVSAIDARSDLVTIADPDLCYRFTARIIRNVKVGPSPKWLVDRLEAVGERSINNVADITNYVMLELGQPMHAFDRDKLEGGRIIVRRAKNGEKITTLKEEEKTLDDSVLAICDAEKPVAIGGVIGGLDSSITDETTSVLLEVAYFDRPSVRSTSRKLNITTEASYRFERGVDIEALKLASDRATQLICELAGGTAGEFVDTYPNVVEAASVVSNDLSAAVTRLTGLDVEQKRCIEVLAHLGIAEDAPSNFSSPSWRHDIAIEEDLVEEVARHVGYENIGSELPPAFGAGEYQPNELRKLRLRQALVDLGFDEAISYSFIPTSHDETFATLPGFVSEGSDERFVELKDSVIEGSVRMRPSVLPGLLAAVRHNFNYQHRDLRLFEIGRVFAADDREYSLPKEVEALGIVLTGGILLGDRSMPERMTDLYDAKGAIEAAFEALGLTSVTYTPIDSRHLAKGQAAAISVNGIEVGTFGRLADDIAGSYKFKQDVFVGEIDLSSVLNFDQPALGFRPLSIFPGITRDVSLVVKRDMTYGEIRDTIEQLGFELCRQTSFVDSYEGKGMASDERSITIRLEYRSDERTLVEAEVDEIHDRIIKGLEDKLGIKPRV